MNNNYNNPIKQNGTEMELITMAALPYQPPLPHYTLLSGLGGS
jgi:hypothetical protein